MFSLPYITVKKIGNTAILIENYLFPLLFLYFACLKAVPVFGKSRLLYLSLIQISDSGAIIEDLTFLTTYITDIVLLLFNLLIMCSLIIRRDLYK